MGWCWVIKLIWLFVQIVVFSVTYNSTLITHQPFIPTNNNHIVHYQLTRIIPFRRRFRRTIMMLGVTVTMTMTMTLLSLRLLQQLLHSLHSTPHLSPANTLRRLLLRRIHLTETRHRVLANLQLNLFYLPHTTLQLLVEVARRRVLAFLIARAMSVALHFRQMQRNPPCSDSTEPRESPSQKPRRGPSAASNASSREHACSREYPESCAPATPYRNESNARGPLHPASSNQQEPMERDQPWTR